MPAARTYLLLLLLPFWLPFPVRGLEPEPPVRYVDDEMLSRAFDKALAALAKKGKAPAAKELKKQLSRTVAAQPPLPAPPGARTPDEIYRGGCQSVAIISSAWKAGDDQWETGEPATAWIVSEDGLLVTSHHVFAQADDGEVFGVMLHDGTFHAVEEIMAADLRSDTVVFRIAAKGLKALPLAVDELVGNRIFVISHPDRQFFTFTQGTITRYTVQHDEEDDAGMKFMCITADYARGSSGGPVLNERGAVVGMVCSTQTTYYGEKGKDKNEDVQMVVKFCVPGESIRKLLGKDKPDTADRNEKSAAP